MNGIETIREHIADLCHRQWSNWMQYLFSKCERLRDGRVAIPVELAERWNRQVITQYNDLSIPEQQSDRKEADRFINLIKTEWEFIPGKIVLQYDRRGCKILHEGIEIYHGTFSKVDEYRDILEKLNFDIVILDPRESS